MNTGDSAEQVVRLSLEGTEVALRLSGAAAKNIAAAIYTVYKNRDKTKIKGKQKLTSMLRSGKEIKVFTIKEEDLKVFAKVANRYGVVYCAIRGKTENKDGIVDILVRAEDDAKINSIAERFNFSTVNSASIKQELSTEKQFAKVPDDKVKKVDPRDELIDDLMSQPEHKEGKEENPPEAKMEKSPPSEQNSKGIERTSEVNFGTKKEEKSSVKKELIDIKEQLKQKMIFNEHKDPQKKKKRKNKFKGR